MLTDMTHVVHPHAAGFTRWRSLRRCGARLRNRKSWIATSSGGVLVFGVNGMRILRGDEDPRDVASLSRHVAAKRDTLEEARALNPYSRQILSDLLPRPCRGSHTTGKDGFEKQLLLDDPREGVGLRHPDRAWPRHRHVRFRHPLCRLVRHLSRQRQKRRQAAQRTQLQRQPDAAQGADRVCARRRANRQLSVPRQALRVRCGARRHCAQAASRGLLRPRQALP